MFQNVISIQTDPKPDEFEKIYGSIFNEEKKE
jgi:hypothetical protein